MWKNFAGNLYHKIDNQPQNPDLGHTADGMFVENRKSN